MSTVVGIGLYMVYMLYRIWSDRRERQRATMADADRTSRLIAMEKRITAIETAYFTTMVLHAITKRK